jgi:hypothetical protein
LTKISIELVGEFHKQKLHKKNATFVKKLLTKVLKYSIIIIVKEMELIEMDLNEKMRIMKLEEQIKENKAMLERILEILEKTIDKQ